MIRLPGLGYDLEQCPAAKPENDAMERKMKRSPRRFSLFGVLVLLIGMMAANPVFAQDQEVGPRPRPDGSKPGRNERVALAEIAGPVARAIEVERRREAREAALDARLEVLEGRITALGRKGGTPKPAD